MSAGGAGHVETFTPDGYEFVADWSASGAFSAYWQMADGSQEHESYDPSTGQHTWNYQFADGSYTDITSNGSGATSAVNHYADGSSSSYTQNASGLNVAWARADGSYGSDAFNSDGTFGVAQHHADGTWESVAGSASSSDSATLYAADGTSHTIST